MNTYRPTLRPASSFCLPRNVKWFYVEAPSAEFLRNASLRNLPVSKHRYGIIETDRALTADELIDFDLEAAPATANPNENLIDPQEFQDEIRYAKGMYADDPEGEEVIAFDDSPYVAKSVLGLGVWVSCWAYVPFKDSRGWPE